MKYLISKRELSPRDGNPPRILYSQLSTLVAQFSISNILEIGKEKNLSLNERKRNHSAWSTEIKKWGILFRESKPSNEESKMKKARFYPSQYLWKSIVFFTIKIILSRDDRLKIGILYFSLSDIRNNDGEKSWRVRSIRWKVHVRLVRPQESRSHRVPANWTRESARIGCSVSHGSRTPWLSFPFLLSNTCICVECLRIDVSGIRVIVLHILLDFSLGRVADRLRKVEMKLYLDDFQACQIILSMC